MYNIVIGLFSLDKTYIIFIIMLYQIVNNFRCYERNKVKYVFTANVYQLQGTKQALAICECERLRSSTQVSALVHKSEYCPVIRFTGLAVICNLSQNRSAINIRLRTFVNLEFFLLSLFSDLGPYGQLMIYKHFGN